MCIRDSSDTSAVDGGIIVKGTTDKKITWKGADAGVTYNTWVSSENFDLASGKYFSLNAIKIADPNTNTIGPNNGTVAGQIDVSGGSAGYTLGSATTGAGATSFNFTGTGEIKLPSGDISQRNSNPLNGMLRYNGQTNVFEGYSNGAWGSIGGNVAVSSPAPSNAVEGDLWYDTDDGRLFVYYNDGATTQWVDASPNGTPTDLVVDGTGTFGGDLTVQSGTAPNLLLKVTSTQATNTNKAFTINNNDQTEGLDISYKGEILPKADANVNLGGPSNRWANIYSADLQLSNEGAATR